MKVLCDLTCGFEDRAKMSPVSRVCKEAGDPSDLLSLASTQDKQLSFGSFEIRDTRDGKTFDREARDELEMKGIFGDFKVRRDQQEQSHGDQKQRGQELDGIERQEELYQQT